MLIVCALLILAPVYGALTGPVLPISIAAPGSWPSAGAPQCQHNYCGDIRAVIDLTAADITGNSATVQVWWRRRDPTPFNKTVIILDATNSQALTVTSLAVQSDCGVVTFSSPTLQPGRYYAYYLPYRQSGGGAGLHFSWLGCNATDNSHTNPCILGGSDSDDVCASPTPASQPVQGLENRDAFNAFTEMEMMATAEEKGATVAALTAAGVGMGVFPESRDLSIRVLYSGGLPVRWAPGGDGPQPTATPAITIPSVSPGEWVAFQLGLFAHAGEVRNVSYTATPFFPSSPSSPPFTIVNLEGRDVFGVAFNNTQYTLQQGEVGSLWCGLPVPTTATPGAHSGTVTLSSPSFPTPITVAVSVVVGSGPPVPYGGAENITSMARLAWLNSQRGLEDTVPYPFVAVSGVGGGGVAGAAAAPLTLTSLLKTITIADTGFPATIDVVYPRVRGGVAANTTHALLSTPVTFSLYTPQGAPLPPPTLVTPATITSITNSSVAWQSQWTSASPGGGVASVSVAGAYDFTSYMNVVVTVSNSGSAPLGLGDIRLSVPMASDMLGYIVGMENSGAHADVYKDKVWRWVNTTGSNKVWWGRGEGGILLNLKGEGIQWDSPMFGADYPIIPEIPASWGGVAQENGAYGVNITGGVATAFSGPRTLAVGESVRFLFDLAITPSKPQNWGKHWGIRTRQIGYDVPYSSPAEVAALGVSVVTLHQGTPGVVNGSLINPWINYPFLNDTVPFLTNFTEQSNALGMSTKFYYTIRELSSRAPEMFAFNALQGEILVDLDPFNVVQPGYGHDWDQHGGAAYLHQHYVEHYGGCWQQGESQLVSGQNEWDPSICSRGVSRLFNYYVEGLYWSMSQPPYINGIYYDGQNFPREGMIRIRRAANAAAEAAGKGLYPLLDLHTGREPTPDVCSYASHIPLIDYMWNGEGFDWSSNAAPPYWLVETSNTAHGMHGDMLGSGAASIFKGMLFGMTQRDAQTSQDIWRFWDAVNISGCDAHFGWWQMDGAPAVTVVVSGDSSPAPPPNCTWKETIGSYYGSVNEECIPSSGPTKGCWDVPQKQEDILAACCKDVSCEGFSFSPGSGLGCCKADSDGPFKDNAYNGFLKLTGPPPPPCNQTLASTWSSFGSHAVVVVATWCPGAVNFTLAVNWEELGLDAGTAVASLPDVPGVQVGKEGVNPSGPFELNGGGSGIFLFIKAP